MKGTDFPGSRPKTLHRRREVPDGFDDTIRTYLKKDRREKNLNAPVQPQTATGPKRPNRNRLLIAVALIGLAVAALVAVEQIREHPFSPSAPHEPSQALITPPAITPEPPLAGSPTEAKPAEPPPPPVVVNEPDQPVPPPATPRKASPVVPDGTAYLVQAGVFASTANALSLQQKLAKAGIRAKVETRVQLGPYKERREAEQAMAKLKKLGVINAVMVPAR